MGVAKLEVMSNTRTMGVLKVKGHIPSCDAVIGVVEVKVLANIMSCDSV